MYIHICLTHLHIYLYIYVYIVHTLTHREMKFIYNVCPKHMYMVSLYSMFICTQQEHMITKEPPGAHDELKFACMYMCFICMCIYIVVYRVNLCYKSSCRSAAEIEQHQLEDMFHLHRSFSLANISFVYLFSLAENSLIFFFLNLFIFSSNK